MRSAVAVDVADSRVRGVVSGDSRTSMRHRRRIRHALGAAVFHVEATIEPEARSVLTEQQPLDTARARLH